MQNLTSRSFMVLAIIAIASFILGIITLSYLVRTNTIIVPDLVSEEDYKRSIDYQNIVLSNDSRTKDGVECASFGISDERYRSNQTGKVPIDLAAALPETTLCGYMDSSKDNYYPTI